MNSPQKIALITGGSRGLGRNTAISFARTGGDVIITYRSNQREADSAVSEIVALGHKAVALQLDTGNVSTFDTFVAEIKNVLSQTWKTSQLDFLVNNAGIGFHASFAETSEESFDQLMNIHFKGVYFLTQKLLPVIKDGGRIVNISSGLTRFSIPGSSAYACMKGAIEVLTRYLAKELGPRHITVNTVAPGAIETDFGGGMVRDNSQMNHFIASQTALERAGLPDDIGPMIASLLTENNRWINAQRIEVSGGMFL